MKKIVLLLVVGAAGYWWWAGGGSNPVAVKGNTVELSSGSQVLTFEKTRPAQGTYMLFGATGRAGNHDEGWFSGIPLARAQEIKSRHPDFHRCDSAGANEAKASLVDLTVVAADPAMAPRFREAADEFQRRFAAKANRLCVKVTGHALKLVGASVSGVQAASIPQPPPGNETLLLDAFEAVDCSEVL